jgi:hypothetical protein
MNADNPMKAGWTSHANKAPTSTRAAGSDPNLPLQRNSLSSADHQKPCFLASQGTALDVDDVAEPGL